MRKFVNGGLGLKSINSAGAMFSFEHCADIYKNLSTGYVEFFVFKSGQD